MDDIQLHFTFKPHRTDHFNVCDCLSAIKDWMNRNFPQINADKTEVLIVAADSIASKVASCTGSLSSNVCSNLRDLGIIFD